MTALISRHTFANEIERTNEVDYLLCTGRFLFEALYYNNTVADYEPVIENWGMGLEVAQHSPNTGKDVTLQADKMLNINLSYASIILNNY